MRVEQLCRGLLAGAVALAVCVGLAGRASAVAVSYTIDPTMSSLTLAVTAFPVTPQIPGADTTALGGTLSADLTAGVLTFSGGSFIDALLNPAAAALPATAFNLAGKFASEPGRAVPGHDHWDRGQLRCVVRQPSDRLRCATSHGTFLPAPFPTGPCRPA